MKNNTNSKNKELIKMYAIDSIHDEIEKLNPEIIRRISECVERFIPKNEDIFKITRIDCSNDRVELDFTHSTTLLR